MINELEKFPAQESMGSEHTKELYQRCSDLQITYQRYDHPAVYTCEEAKRLAPEMEGADTKNLFLRDKKGERHFLVVVGYDKSVDIKKLAKELAVTKLSFASPERLQKYLGIEPGSVSILAAIRDVECAVEVVVDSELWRAEHLCCHPLVNTSTLVIARKDIERLLAASGHTIVVIDVPGREV